MHRIPPKLGREHLVDLGGGLHVLSPAAAIALQPRRCGDDLLAESVLLAKLMFEATGIFALPPKNARMRLVTSELVSAGVLTKGAFEGIGVYGHCDARGRPCGSLHRSGLDMPWCPSFDRHGALTDMWKRPPLTNLEAIGEALRSLGLTSGRSHRSRALMMAVEGAASPAEVKAVMLLCCGRRYGGEGLPRPVLNREVVYSPEAAMLAHARRCFPDVLWQQTAGVLEVQGEAFHADEGGFRQVSGRTAALECMGYSVAELLYEQMKSLELFDALLPTLMRKLGHELHGRAPAFLRARNRLHEELFDRPYGPV